MKDIFLIYLFLILLSLFSYSKMSNLLWERDYSKKTKASFYFVAILTAYFIIKLTGELP